MASQRRHSGSTSILPPPPFPLDHSQRNSPLSHRAHCRAHCWSHCSLVQTRRESRTCFALLVLLVSLSAAPLLRPTHASPPDVSALYIVRLRSAPPVASYRGGIPGYPATAVWDSDPNGNATDATADDTTAGSSAVSAASVSSSSSAAAGAATTSGLGSWLGRRLRRPRVNVRAPGVRAFKQLLQRMQQAVLRDSGVDAGKMIYSYKHASNGFSATLTAAQVQRMRRHPSVASVTQARVLRPATTDSYKFLGLPGSLWAAAGGPSSAGDGTVIGIVDTGIWPEHTSFDDTGYSSTLPAGWAGTCPTTSDFACNNKIIGGGIFHAGFESGGTTLDLSGDWNSPRDAAGHGTWCAGAAAGNNNVPIPNTGTASGMAPGARLAIYKVFWQTNGYMYATSPDIFSAVDQAVADGVDVLSLSLGGASPTDTYFDDVPFISVHAVSGNAVSGRGMATLGGNTVGGNTVGGNTVGGNTVSGNTVGRNTVGRNTVGGNTVGGNTVGGNTVGGNTVGGNTVSGNTVGGNTVGGNTVGGNTVGGNTVGGNTVGGNTVGGNTVSGNTVGGNTVGGNTAGVFVAFAAGNEGRPSAFAATGYRTLCNFSPYYMTVGASSISRNSASISSTTAAATSASAASTLETPFNTTTPTALAAPTTVSTLNGARIPASISPAATAAPVVAYFSSTGPLAKPSVATPAAYPSNTILKPDIIAPGVQLYAAAPGMTVGSSGGFQALSGTSMATPHIAGIAALIIQQHPDWTPSQIMSAMMTTARTTNTGNGAIKNEYGAAASPWEIGAGHVVPARVVNPGLTYDAGEQDFKNFLAGQNYNRAKGEFGTASLRAVSAKNLNRPAISLPKVHNKASVTRTVTNVADTTSTYTVKIKKPAGVKVKVSPSRFTIAPGQRKTYTVTVVVKWASQSFKFGSLTWVDNKGHSVRSVLAVQPSSACWFGC
ncbi:unnamed protein product [Closterium sp. Yama58-4]|nr:unnamed protein product [Closterium sp. Yama58-4]